MYAEIERLLSQIKRESGSDLLATGVSASSGPALTRSVPLKTGIELLDEALSETTDATPIIELLGTPASGKTQVLYQICIHVSLAQTATLQDGQKVDLGGSELHALLIDVDGKSDVQLLAQYMRALVKDKLGDQTDKETVDGIVNAALSRIHVFAPDSTQSLIATLSMLPKYVADSGFNKSQCVVLIDGLGSHFWYDRRAANFVTMKSRRATPAFRLQQLFVDTLQEVQAYLGCVCFVTSILFLRYSGDLATARSVSQESMGTDNHSSQGSQLSQQQGRQARQIESGNVLYNDHMIPRWRSVVARSFVLEGSSMVGSQQRPAVTAVTFTEVGGSRRQQTVYVGPNGLQTFQ